MPELLFLSRRDVVQLLPPLDEQIALAEETYRALARGRVEMPPKPGIHPRPNAFLHAMPAYLADGDVAALKWVSGYPENPARGLPYISGLIVVNDADTGLPAAVLDAAEITAARTAAASGVCIRRFAPEAWQTVGILGCGEQGRYHARIVSALQPDARMRAWDPVPERVGTLPGRVEGAADSHSAVDQAEVVISAAPIAERPDPVVAREWVGNRYLVLPLDFDASVQRAVIEDAELFAVDDIAQFEHYRAAGHFQGWPVPALSLGEALGLDGTFDRVACVNLGIGALDAAFAAAVVDGARREGLGVRVEL
jgi:ornithine cyclodeaminase/alanine dehydrogenase-like protein (mu-crystallin family)